MVRRKYRVIRIAGWIILGFVSLILIVTLVFYLGRGWILNRAVTYLNEQQPGEVQMGQMNLIPFMHFPDVSLQLRNVSYYEKKTDPDSLLQEPILFLDEIYVTLDVVDLIRGDLLVSQASMEKGFIRFEIYEDSISNLEYALGIRFDEKKKKEDTDEAPALRVDMERIALSDILLLMDDRTRDDHINVTVNQLESRFSYLPDIIETDVELNIDINYLKYLTYSSETERNITFESKVSIDPVQKVVALEPSSMHVSDLELEAWGTYGYLGDPNVDLAFRASNKGLEVLNFLFRGILDLDEIEQIGSGSIYLSGNINGVLGDQLPMVRINGTAHEIGFRIKSIDKDVTDISFKMYGTNGARLDYSEGLFVVEGFTATFPEGTIKADISASDLTAPRVAVKLEGDLDLSGLEQILKTNVVTDLEGHVKLDGNINGVINRENEEFLNNAGAFRAVMTDVGFSMKRDSLGWDRVQKMNGEVYMDEQILETENLAFDLNGNRLTVGAKIENLLLYLMDANREVTADISLASDTFHLSKVIRDTSLTNMLGDELTGLHFRAGAAITKQDLDAFLHDDSIPVVELSVDSFGIKAPVYAEISNMNASLTLGPDTIALHYLNGIIGESRFDFTGTVANYRSLSGKDSSAVLGVDFNLTSDLMRAEDLFMFDQEFLLPEIYKTEYLEAFHLDGSLEAPVAGLVKDSVSLDFGLNIRDLGWNFRYYPLRFDEFMVQVRRKGDQLFIDNFQGMIGENNLKLSATIGNFTDTLIENMYGGLVLESDLLDFNELLNYQLPDGLKDTSEVDTSTVREPPKLDQIEYPDFNFTLNINELRYGDYEVFGVNGKLRSSREKVFYLDTLATSGGTGGRMEFNGQVNVSNPNQYNFSAQFDIDDVDITDLDFEMKSGEEIYTLKENFNGLVSADGLAEIFITPDLKFDLPMTTAVFNVHVVDGALINFTPLQAAAKYLDNKDLNHVKFNTLFNSGGSFSLIDSKIQIPLMSVESTIGQLLIEGEQGLDNTYLYLLRLPTWLVKGAARSRLSGSEEEQEEEQIYEMKRGNFMRMTVWGDGEESEVKLGDKRDKYR